MKKWTKKEDDFLSSMISRNPQNLQATFNYIAHKLERSTKAVENRWYNTVSKQGSCFFTIGNTKTISNKKVIPITNKEKIKRNNKSLWETFTKLLT